MLDCKVNVIQFSMAALKLELTQHSGNQHSDDLVINSVVSNHYFCQAHSYSIRCTASPPFG